MPRIPAIDIAKGIGILMVVLGHTTHSLWVHDFIYLFHMPLFFLLSGLFFQYTPDVKAFLLKKVRGLLVPYVLFMLLFIPVKSLEYSLIGGGYARLLTHNYSDRPLWFLLVLFALNLWTYGLEFLRQRSPRWACLLAVWLTVAGYVLGCRGVSLPCYLVRTLLCFPFFYLGYIGRKGWLQLPVARPRALGFIACVILAVGMACRMQLDVMMVRVDARPWLYTVVPLAGVVATLIVSGYVEQSPRLCAMLSYFGRNSLYIFACHWPWLGLLEHELPTWIPDPKAMCLVTTVTVLAISLLMGAALRRWLPFVFR